MSELKTKPADARAEDFIATIEDTVKREDAFTLRNLPMLMLTCSKNS